MTLASILIWAAVATCSVIVASARNARQARLALSILGMATGVGIIMLSGRAVGLIWLLIGAMATCATIVSRKDRPLGFLELRPGWLQRAALACPIALVLAMVLLWEPPPIGMPLVIEPLQIAETLGIAFGRHTWSVVGVSLLGVLAISGRGRGEEA